MEIPQQIPLRAAHFVAHPLVLETELDVQPFYIVFYFSRIEFYRFKIFVLRNEFPNVPVEFHLPLSIQFEFSATMSGSAALPDVVVKTDA